MTEKEIKEITLDLDEILDLNPKRITFKRVELYMKLVLLILNAFGLRFFSKGAIVLPHWLKIWPYILFARDVYLILKNKDEIQNGFNSELFKGENYTA
jgi:hypothetical protein